MSMHKPLTLQSEKHPSLFDSDVLKGVTIWGMKDCHKPDRCKGFIEARVMGCWSNAEKVYSTASTLLVNDSCNITGTLFPWEQ